jgi:hypothetical protein
MMRSVWTTRIRILRHIIRLADLRVMILKMIEDGSPRWNVDSVKYSYKKQSELIEKNLKALEEMQEMEPQE